MKLTEYESKHLYIQFATEYERVVNSWVIALEDKDFDEVIRQRFANIIVEQHHYIKDKGVPMRTMFKATRTNWFDADEKRDKQKKLVIAEVTKFLHNFKNHALVAQWSEQSAHN